MATSGVASLSSVPPVWPWPGRSIVSTLNRAARTGAVRIHNEWSRKPPWTSTTGSPSPDDS